MINRRVGYIFALSILPITLLIVNYQYCNQPSYESALKEMASTQQIIKDKITEIDQMHKNGTLHFRWNNDGNQRMGTLSVYQQTNLITIILPPQLKNEQSLIKTQFNHLLSKIFQLINAQGDVSVHTYILHPSMIDRNVMQSIPMIFQYKEYMQSFWKQVMEITPLQNCAYSTGQCGQYFIYIGGALIKSQGFSKIGQNKYAMQSYSNSTAFSIFVDILGIGPLFQSISQSQKIMKETAFLSKQYKYAKLNAFLSQCNTILSYFMYTSQSSFYKKSDYQLEQLHKILHSINTMINDNEYEKLELHPLRDSRLGVLDAFPSDYFIGIHLPLYMLALYPLIMSIKILYFALKRRY